MTRQIGRAAILVVLVRAPKLRPLRSVITSAPETTPRRPQRSIRRGPTSMSSMSRPEVARSGSTSAAPITLRMVQRGLGTIPMLTA